MHVDGLSGSPIVNFLRGFVQPRQLLFFFGFEVDRVFVYLIRTFWYRMLRQIALSDNVSRNGWSFHIVYMPCSPRGPERRTADVVALCVAIDE